MHDTDTPVHDTNPLTSSLRTWLGGSHSEVTLRVSMLVAALSLILSVVSMWHANQAHDQLRTVESRLACLELPGSNPCPMGGN